MPTECNLFFSVILLSFCILVQVKVPIVFRGPNGAAAGVAAQHSQDFSSWYSHCPGLKVCLSVCNGRLTPVDSLNPIALPFIDVFTKPG